MDLIAQATAVGKAAPAAAGHPAPLAVPQAAPAPVAVPAVAPVAVPSTPFPSQPAWPTAAPIAARLPDVADAFPPFRLEVRVSPSRPRRGQQAVLELQITPTALSADADLELVVEAGVFGSPAPTLRTAVAPGARQVLPGLRFVGSDSFRLAGMLRRAADGRTLGRWSATHTLTVKDPAAGGGDDVFALAGQILKTLPGTPEGGWQPLDLQPDPAYRRRQGNTAPPQTDPFPGLPPPGGSAPTGAVRLCVGPRAVAAVWGTSAVFSRGGLPSSPWWLRPAPYNVDDHKRISREHATVSLRDGRAWVTDTSSGGTFVTQPGLRPRSPLVKGRPEKVAAGDEVPVPGVAPFRVALETHNDRVFAVWLYRTDVLAGTLSYLLTDGTAPVPLRVSEGGPPVGWVAGGGAGVALLAPGGAWAAPAAAADVPLSDGRPFRWDHAPAAPEQDWFLSRS